DLPVGLAAREASGRGIAPEFFEMRTEGSSGSIPFHFEEHRLRGRRGGEVDVGRPPAPRVARVDTDDRHTSARCLEEREDPHARTDHARGPPWLHDASPRNYPFWIRKM